jgi:hypothetical protein
MMASYLDISFSPRQVAVLIIAWLTWGKKPSGVHRRGELDLSIPLEYTVSDGA